MTVEEFYEQYFKFCGLFNANRINFKKEFFKNYLPNNKVYKFIGLDKNEKLCKSKLDCILNNQLWFSNVKYFEDKNEFKCNIDKEYVKNKLNYSLEYIDSIINIMQIQLRDVCSTTDRISNFMWNEYANYHSGICCVFNIKNFDWLLPCYYTKDKDKFDFTEEFISINNPENIELLKNNEFNKSIYDSNKIMSLPSVLKDKYYDKENEIRLITTNAYDDANDTLGGIINSTRKDDLGYKGHAFSYEKCGLKLEKIIIGYNTPSNIINEIKKMDCKIEIEKKNIE